MQKNNSTYFQHFDSVLTQFSDQAALIHDNKVYTYRDLQQQIKDYSSELHDHSIFPGSVVALIGDFDPGTIACFFSLAQMNTILVPLLRNHTESYIKTCTQTAQVDFIVTIDLYQKINIQVKNTPTRHHLIDQVKRKHVPGLILFSSGSTGNPKAAVHDFSKLLSKFIVKSHQLTMINFLMFDNWGGLNTLLRILSGGGTVVTTPDRTPEIICALIEKWKVDILPTSPSFLNLLLLSKAYENKNLSSLRAITYGSEPMSPSTLSRARAAFPHTPFKQTYGLIELGVFKTKSKSDDSLFIKIDPADCKTRIHDGMLELKTDTAMLGYLNAESPFTEDGWFKTGDMVEVDGEYLKILGRNSEIINVGGEKVYPIEVETCILNFTNIEDVMVFKEPHPLVGNIVCAKIKLITPLESLELEKEFIISLKKYCNENLARFKVPTKVSISLEPLTSLRQKKIRAAYTVK